jgi:hypothetical protein
VVEVERDGDHASARRDLSPILLANGGVRGGTPAETAHASRRLVAYLLQAFRAEGAAPLPPPVALPLDAALR